jgi:hypothetical protein
MSDIANYPDGLSSFGHPLYGAGGMLGLGLGRNLGHSDQRCNSRTQVCFVDKKATGKADGTSWKNAYTDLQDAINAARYDFGTTDINYDDESDNYVIVAPGDYSSEGRIAWSSKNLHILGMGMPGTDTGVTINPTSPSTFAFGGSGTGTEVSNLFIGVASAVYGFYWEQMDGGSWFHDLYIYGNSSNATTGIYTGGMKGTSAITRNKISGFVTSCVTVAGGADMYFTDAKIDWNQFGATATCVDGVKVGVNVVAANSSISHNKFIGDNFTETWDVDCTAADVLVADNWAVSNAGSGGTERDNHES